MSDSAGLRGAKKIGEQRTSSLFQFSWKNRHHADAGARENEREVALENALALALYRLEGHEPKDSRAVSDEFVAMAAVQAGIDDAKCHKIIEVALASHLISGATHTSGELTK